MNIAVIAANGRTGKVFVQKALAAGHSIRAGVYKSNDLPEHPNLTVVNCNATNQADLANLINGQNAVVSFIGHVKGSPDHVQSDAMRSLIRAMKDANLRRIVSLTGTGVRFPGDRVSMIDRLLNISIRIIDPTRVKDGVEHVEVLKGSGLDWTILRVLKLQNTKPSAFQLKAHGPTKYYVSRQEVAQAALDVLQDHSFIKEAPILSKP